MKRLFRYWLNRVGLIAVVTAGPLSLGYRCLAADPPSPSAAPAGAATDGSVKIKPYTGPPIYLDEPEVVAAPKIVSRETVSDKYGDGKLRVERQIARYSDDHFEADGFYREYYPNGQKFVEGQFRNGRQHGEWTFWFDNGQQNRKATYDSGQPDGAWEVHRADGTLAAKRGFRRGLRDGEWITYDDTGKTPLREEHYVDGKADGVWKVWYPSGQLAQQIGYKQGLQHGTSTEWNDKGEKRRELSYVDNKPDGAATLWLPDGHKIIQQYKNGRLQSESRQ